MERGMRECFVSFFFFFFFFFFVSLVPFRVSEWPRNNAFEMKQWHGQDTPGPNVSAEMNARLLLRAERRAFLFLPILINNLLFFRECKMNVCAFFLLLLLLLLVGTTAKISQAILFFPPSFFRPQNLDLPFCNFFPPNSIDLIAIPVFFSSSSLFTLVSPRHVRVCMSSHLYVSRRREHLRDWSHWIERISGHGVPRTT